MKKRERCFEQDLADGGVVRVRGSEPLPADVLENLADAAREWLRNQDAIDRDLVEAGLIDLGGEG